MLYLLSFSVCISACFAQNEIYYILTNNVREPKFNNTLTMEYMPGQAFQRYMEVAADYDKGWRFSATYFNKTVGGYYIDAINHTVDTYPVDKTYWEFFVNNKPAGPGVSQYVPKPNDFVLFNFTNEDTDSPGLRRAKYRWTYLE